MGNKSATELLHDLLMKEEVGYKFTKDSLKTKVYDAGLDGIKVYVDRFIDFARTQTDQRHAPLIYQVTCIGCGLAGLKHEDIAPMFRMATKNVLFDDLWKPWLKDYGFKFWGTY